jgi:hypothetical protein
MTLLAETLEGLTAHKLRGIVIGAAAMAVHGVARATMDIDLLLVGRESLDSAAWESLRNSGVSVNVTRGDADDPLEGVVRLRRAGDLPIDVVVGSAAWQRRAIERAPVVDFLGNRTAVATACDLILLKLFAGSPQDQWDVSRLLAASRGPDLARNVETELGWLPAECRALWESIVVENRR